MKIEVRENQTVDQRIAELTGFARNRAELFDFAYHATLSAECALAHDQDFIFRFVGSNHQLVRYRLNWSEQVLGLDKCAFSLYQDLIECGQKELADDIRINWDGRLIPKVIKEANELLCKFTS